MDDKDIQKIIDKNELPLDLDFEKAASLKSLVSEFITSGFQSRIKWFAVITMVYQVIFLILSIVVAIMFFRVTQTHDKILYGTCFSVLMTFMIGTKMMYMQMIDKNNITREIKRLELRISELAETLKNK